ncbi:MAG TPA: DGQHR domain-containing protein [Abditibacteriaceae bacterium]|jgi:DGQHR domain-containing protein
MKEHEKQDELFVPVRVMEVTQPLGTFYVGVMKAADLRAIASADTRRQVEREIETYAGIQRELSKERQVEISEYITKVDSAFPNSFIISVKQDDVVSYEDDLLRIKAHDKAASIIDGQHRLSGFTADTIQKFDLIVSIFIDLPIEDQAMLFATINLKQTRVNPSLVYDLFEETKLRSPQKTCHDIAKAMNADEASPLYRRIKILGKKTDDYTGILTQATFIKRLLPLVCKNPETTQDQIKRRIGLSADDAVNRECIFWKFFVDDEDWATLKILLNYFGAVKNVFASDWDSKDSPLPRSIGFSALMRLLPVLYGQGKRQKTLTKEFFEGKLNKAKHLAPFTFEKYPANAGGENKLYRDLLTQVGESDSNLPVNS